jgi:hypothetical protein
MREHQALALNVHKVRANLRRLTLHSAPVSKPDPPGTAGVALPPISCGRPSLLSVWRQRWCGCSGGWHPLLGCRWPISARSTTSWHLPWLPRSPAGCSSTSAPPAPTPPAFQRPRSSSRRRTPARRREAPPSTGRARLRSARASQKAYRRGAGRPRRRRRRPRPRPRPRRRR